MGKKRCQRVLENWKHLFRSQEREEFKQVAESFTMDLITRMFITDFPPFISIMLTLFVKCF